MNLWNYLKEQQKCYLTRNCANSVVRSSLTICGSANGRMCIPSCAVVKEQGIPVNSEPADYKSVHLSLLSGLLSHVGQKDTEKQEFTGARNARFSVFGFRLI